MRDLLQLKCPNENTVTCESGISLLESRLQTVFRMEIRPHDRETPPIADFSIVGDDGSYQFQ